MADAKEITVRLFDLTMAVPVVLTPDRSGREPSQDDVHRRLTASKVWTEVDPSRLSDEERRRRYQAFVYFHAFARRLLFREVGGPNPALRTWTRTDLAEVRATVGFGPAAKAYRLTVLGAELHLFDTGVLFATVRLTSPEAVQLSLADTLTIQDTLRRVYVPYWFEDTEEKNGKFHPGHSLEVLTLTRTDGTVASEERLGDDATIASHLDAMRAGEPYLSKFWQAVFQPLVIPGAGTAGATQIVDERAPIWSYLAVDDPRQITAPDWLRLVDVESAGDSAIWPYSASFLGPDPLGPYAYDRFWVAAPSSPAAGSYGNKDDHTTRWLVGTRSTIGVGSYNNGEGFWAETAREHLRAMYFWLGLIAHAQRASLLAFQRQLAGAVDEIRGHEQQRKPQLEFERRLNRIEVGLMRFRNTLWFPEVSGQDQGRELFDLIQRQLANRQLLESLDIQLTQASETVRRYTDAEQTRTIERLTVIATVLLVLTPIMQSNLVEGLFVNALVTAGLLFLGAVFLWFAAPAIVAAFAKWDYKLKRSWSGRR